MKKLLILLFSFLLLSSPSVFADDISDFQIEGISIGDSLLDYLTEDEILEEIEENKDNYLYLNEPYKYIQIDPMKNFPTYDNLTYIIKNNSTNQYITNKNEKYTILLIRGHINYNEDFDSCLQKRDEIDEVLSSMFPNTQKIENVYKSAADPSGKSIVDTIDYLFKSGEEVSNFCVNYDETFRIKKNWNEGLNVTIETAEVKFWLGDWK